jgi:hypothetical protein
MTPELRLPEEGLSDGVVRVRHWTQDDVPAIVDAMSDPEISRWVPHIPFPYSEDDAREFLSMDAEVRRAGTGAHLAVTDAVSVLIGGASLVVDHVDKSGFTGYWVAARDPPPRNRHANTSPRLEVGLRDAGSPPHLPDHRPPQRSVAAGGRTGRLSAGGTRDRACPNAGGRYEDVLYRLSRGDFNPVAGSN